MNIVNILLFSSLTLFFIKNLIYPYYIIIEDGKVTIVRDYFISKKVRLEEIKKMVIDEGLFGNSYFLMMNNTKVKFNANYISNKNKELLKKELENS